MTEEKIVPPDGDNDTHLTDAELSKRLAELVAPSSPAEWREYRALRELRERRADQRSGSVPVAHIAHEVVPRRHQRVVHLEQVIEWSMTGTERAEKALAGVIRVLEWVEQLVRRSNQR